MNNNHTPPLQINLNGFLLLDSAGKLRNDLLLLVQQTPEWARYAQAAKHYDEVRIFLGLPAEGIQDITGNLEVIMTPESELAKFYASRPHGPAQASPPPPPVQHPPSETQQYLEALRTQLDEEINASTPDSPPTGSS